MFDRLLFLRHLDDDEELQKVVHKHWIIVLCGIFWPSASFLLAIVTFALFPYRLVAVLAGCWALFSLLWWIRCFLDTYLDAWIITDSAIIDVRWFGWFHRKSARILYSDVEGVSYEIQGILATLCRYGTLSIERISTGAEISLEYVPHPRQVEAIILQSMEAYLHTKNLKDATNVQELLSQMVAQHLQLDDVEEEEEIEHSVP